MQNSPTAQERQEFFELILNEYNKKNKEAAAINQPQPGIPILTRASYRLEQYISANTTQYTFPINVGQVTAGSPTPLANEVRLEQNDNLHIGWIGFYLAVTANAGDNAFRLQTEANEIFLTSAAIALNYQNLWAGNLQILINQTAVLTNIRLSEFYYTGQTQRLSAAANSNFSQIDMSKDGIVPLRPSIMLSGRVTNTVQVNLNNAVTSALAANNSRIVLIFDGLRAQNAAIAKGSLA